MCMYIQYIHTYMLALRGDEMDSLGHVRGHCAPLPCKPQSDAHKVSIYKTEYYMHMYSYMGLPQKGDPNIVP